MRPTCLAFLLLALPGQAAPQLKPVRAVPVSEAARIEGLRAEYDAFRHSPNPTDRQWIALKDIQVHVLVLQLETARERPRPADAIADEKSARASIEGDPDIKNLYDILMFDRRQRAER